MFDTIRSIYRKCIPVRIRRFFRNVAFPERLYSKSFFEHLDRDQAEGYDAMARAIQFQFRPHSVIDVGCGTGGLLDAIRSSGSSKCKGFEYHKAVLRLCSDRNLDVEFLDLTQPNILDTSFDLVICLEVAEHLPPESADQVVANLTSGPSVVIFSAAVPGQGGHDHVNEQPAEYWIEKFAMQFFSFDEQATLILRRNWSIPIVAKWFSHNVLVFRKSLIPDSRD
jgi:SAM-dependent methyltransferase